jgi:hypothetical protein
VGEVGLGAVACVGQEDAGGAGDAGCLEAGRSRLNHRDELVDVCGCLGYLGCKDDLSTLIDHGLGVVGILRSLVLTLPNVWDNRESLT